jgi:uncharacterized protein
MRGVPRWFAVLCVVAFAVVVCAFSLRHALAPAALQLQLSQTTLRADGLSTTELKVHTSGRAIRNLSVESGDENRIVVESVIVKGDEATATLRAGVMPGETSLRISGDGMPPQSIKLATAPDFSDSFGDGTPDFLRLHEAADRAAFRRWFTLLAEAQYYRGPKLPVEIDDCAALVRFSYREALRQHDSTWASAMALPIPPRSGDVRQYNYPHTPLGAAMFRVRDGSLLADDFRNGTFAEFADAKTLSRDNAYNVGHDISRARPGDLFFFRQAEGHASFHAMIFLGRSQIESGAEQYVVYHTGPQGKSPGEMRRLALSELMNFPDARWRPVASNPAFLGVYRWNILRGDE